jgi:hypothetical protein
MWIRRALACAHGDIHVISQSCQNCIGGNRFPSLGFHAEPVEWPCSALGTIAMLGRALSVFREPGDFQAALREVDGVVLVVTGAGAFWARLSRISLFQTHLCFKRICSPVKNDCRG